MSSTATTQHTDTENIMLLANGSPIRAIIEFFLTMVSSIVNLVFEGYKLITRSKLNPEDENFCYMSNREYVPINVVTVTVDEAVSFIEEDAFTDRTAMTSITLPNSIKSIEECAFWNCSSLKKITIPESVMEIGYRAFFRCSSLQSVSLPRSVKTIESATFADCTSITTIDIPDSITRIGIGTFRGCTSLKHVNIPNSVTSIGEEAFSKCSSLGSIILPDSITTIETGLFLKCHSLTSVVLPNSLQFINNLAFGYCSSLTSIAIPGHTVIRNSTSSFFRCKALEERTNSVEDIGISLSQRFANLPLHQTFYNGDMKNIASLERKLNQGNKLSLSSTDMMGMTPLHVLCCHPHATIQMIQKVKAAYPAATSMEDVRGMTPLMIFLASKSINIPSLQNPSFLDLLEVGVSCTEMETILESFDDENKIVEDLNKIDKDTGLLPLMVAASLPQCDLDMVYMIAMKGPDLLSTFMV